LAPNFIVIGHLTRDEHNDGSFTLGGAVTFAGIAARELGYRVGIVTSAADDFPEPHLLHDIDIVRIPSTTTTTFRNIYHGTARTQYVRDIAKPIRPTDVPAEWRNAKIVLLGPLVGEIDATMLDVFSPQTTIAVSPQGWMRQWDTTGLVRPRAWQEAAEILPRVNVLILSDEDLGPYSEQLSLYIEWAPVVIMTRGVDGCTIYQKGKPPIDVAAFATNVVDLTGAGDSFAAGFLIRFHETGDLLRAAHFGNGTASLAIASPGAENMPTRAQVEARVATLGETTKRATR
jgi:sugar/nucleoside kinase (ribokinase family)